MRIALVASLLFVTTALAACDKGAPAQAASVEHTGKPTDKPGTTYGAGVTLDAVVSIDDLLADPRKYEGQLVRVEGMVTDVCPKRGCWMDLAGSAPGKKLKFKVQDGVMVFPMTAKGQQASAEGRVVVTELSLEESKEYAKYQRDEYGADIDPEAITEPMTTVRLDGTGAVLR